MWSNQCIWDHGFVEFGDEYPYPVPYKGRVGMLCKFKIYILDYLLLVLFLIKGE